VVSDKVPAVGLAVGDTAQIAIFGPLAANWLISNLWLADDLPDLARFSL